MPDPGLNLPVHCIIFSIITIIILFQVQMSVFFSYAKACTYYMTVLVILFNILTNGAAVGQNFWLAHWSNQESDNTTKPNL